MYARNGELHIAYQDLGGEGSDLLFLSHPQFPIDVMWDDPLFSGNLGRLAARGRLIACDLHGWGSSDQPSEPFAALQVWMDDIRAVLDTVGVRSASLILDPPICL